MRQRRRSVRIGAPIGRPRSLSSGPRREVSRCTRDCHNGEPKPQKTRASTATTQPCPVSAPQAADVVCVGDSTGHRDRLGRLDALRRCAATLPQTRSLSSVHATSAASTLVHQFYGRGPRRLAPCVEACPKTLIPLKIQSRRSASETQSNCDGNRPNGLARWLRPQPHRPGALGLSDA